MIKYGKNSSPVISKEIIKIDNFKEKKKIENDVNINKIDTNHSETIFNNINNLKKYLKESCKEFDGKFELLEQLKSGSAGSVFLGKLRKTNSKQIAFKFLFNENLKEKREKKTNEKTKKDYNKHIEISIHGILKNKHIPEIYGYYQIQNSSCIAMEYNKYGDLENFKRKILKRSSLSETLVLYIGGGLLEALYYLHSKNKIIHMDIKQQNVLVDDFLNIKLLIFQ